jgi:archaellum biogenesis ATPase FlaH/5S rRNA maturation endonuclease (ribonuclease M5)
MTHVVKRVRCPKCASHGKDTSGDNLVFYADGGAFCFACGFKIPPSHRAEADQSPTDTVLDFFLPSVYLGKRGISDEVIALYGVCAKQNPDSGEIWLEFPVYDANGQFAFAQRRYVDMRTGQLSRAFRSEKGTRISNPLFGWQLVTEKTQRILLCEGLTDTLAAASKLLQEANYEWVVLGVVGAAFAKRAAAFLMRYAENKEVVVAFDNDAAGAEAKSAFTSYLKQNESIIKPRELKIPSAYKDVCEWLGAEPTISLTEHLEHSHHLLSPDIVSSLEIADSFIQYLEALKNEKFLKFHFSPTLANAIKLMPGKLCVVAGDAGKGKSTLVEQIILEVLADGHRVFMISAEMRPAEVALKLVRNAKGINYYDKQVLENLTEEELHSLKAFANALLKRLHMFARFGTCTIQEIEDKLHELVAAGLAPSLLVIDHVLAIADEGTPEELEQIAKQLKALAERQSIPIIALCHVRKQLKSSKRIIYRPQLSDIYNNSGLARYADVVLGVALDPQKRITYVETIKLERMSGGYADVMLKLVDWSLQEVEEDTSSSPSYADAIEASDLDDDVDVEELF